MSCCININVLLDIVHGALLSLCMMYAFIQHFISLPSILGSWLLLRLPGCSLIFYSLCLFFESKPFREKFLVSVEICSLNAIYNGTGYCFCQSNEVLSFL